MVLDKIQREMHLEKITDFFSPLVNKVMGRGHGGRGTRVSAWFNPQQRFRTVSQSWHSGHLGLDNTV